MLAVIGAGLVSLFFDLNGLKPTLADAAYEATGRQLAVDGNIELSLFPRPRATATGVRLSNVAGGSEPDALTIEVVSAQVAWLPLLTGTVDVRQIQASGVRLLVEEGDQEKPSLAFGPPEAAAPSARSTEIRLPDLISVGNIAVVVRDGAGYQEFRISRVFLRPQGNEGLTDVHVGMDRNGVAVIAKGQVGNLLALSDGTPFPLTLAVTAADSTFSIDGSISNLAVTPTLDVVLTAAGPSVSALSPVVGARIPMESAFTLSARLEGAIDTIALREIALSAGTTEVSGEAALDLTGERPQLSAQLRSPSLDFAQITGGSSLATTSDQGSTTGPVLTDIPLPFGFTRSFDADLNLEAAETQMFGVTLRNVVLAIKSNAGVAEIESLTADTAGGGLVASGRLDAQQKDAELSVRAQVTGLDVAKALETFGIPGNTTQRASASLELKSRGATPRELADNVSASMRLSELSVAFDDVARVVLKNASAQFDGHERPILITAEGTVRGEALTFEGQLDPLSTYQPGDPYTFRFVATGADATAEVQADMRAAMVEGLTLRVSARGANLADLSQIAATELPSVGPYDVIGRLSFAENAVRFEDASLRLGESDLRGDIVVNLASDRPYATIKFQSDLIDLTPFAQEEAGMQEDPPVEKSPTETPMLNISPLLAMDSKVEIAANALVMSTIRLDDLSLEASTDNDTIRIDRLSADIDGQLIALSAAAEQTAAGVALSASGEVRGVDAAALVASAGLAERVDIADLTVSVDLSSVGNTASDLVDAVQGEVVVQDLQFAFRSGDGFAHDPILLNSLRLATKGQGNPVSLESRGTLGGEALEVKGTLAPLAELRRMEPAALDISLATPSSQVRIKGTPPERSRPRDLNFSIDAQGLILREAAYAAGLALAPEGPWQVRAEVRATDSSFDITSLAALIGQSDISGTVKMADEGEDRTLVARVTSDNLSLADFIRLDDADPGQEPSSEPTPVEASTGPVFSRTPIEFAPLRRLDVDLAIDVKAFAGRSLSGKNLLLTLNGGDGLFTLDQFAATIEERPIEVKARLDVRGG